MSRVLVSVVFCFILGRISASDESEKQFASLPTVFYQDNYDECILEENTLYCSFKYTVQPLDSQNESSLVKTIYEVSSNPLNFRHDILRHALCLPKSCPFTNSTERSNVLDVITKCYNEKYKPMNLKGTVSDLECDTREPRYPVDWIDMVFLYAFWISVAFVILATFYKPSNTSKKFDWLSAFSLSKNWTSLTTVSSTPEIVRLRIVQWFRVYFLVFIIFGHTGVLLYSLPVVNTRAAEKNLENFLEVWIGGGALCFNSPILMITAWLLTSSMLEFSKRKTLKTVSLILAFIKRYIRLTPALFAVAMFHVTWLRHIGNGPYWNHHIGDEYLRCRKTWWANVLFINNVVDVPNMCLFHTWYLANDMQYIIALSVLIWLITRYRDYFWWIFGTAMTLQILLTLKEDYSYDFGYTHLPKAEKLYDLNVSVKNEQFRIQHLSIIGNFAGSLVGVAFGYIYHNYKDKKIFTTKAQSNWWWTISLLFTYFVPSMPGLQIYFNLPVPGHFLGSLYVALSRPIYSLGIAMTIFKGAQGDLGIYKPFTEWPLVYVMGRLTFSAYLLHLTIIFFRTGIQRSPSFVSMIELTFESFGNVVAIYLLAVPFSLLFESPVAQLLKYFTNGSPKSAADDKKKK